MGLLSNPGRFKMWRRFKWMLCRALGFAQCWRCSRITKSKWHGWNECSSCILSERVCSERYGIHEIQIGWNWQE